MCGLCSEDPNEVKKEQEALEFHAAQLAEFSTILLDMSRGHISPHVPNSGLGDKARPIIRYMVEEFV